MFLFGCVLFIARILSLIVVSPMFWSSLCVRKREESEVNKRGGRKRAAMHARTSRTGSRPVNAPLGFSLHQRQCENTEKWSVAENIAPKRNSTSSFLFSHCCKSRALHFMPLRSCVCVCLERVDVTLSRRALQLFAVGCRSELSRLLIPGPLLCVS